MATKTVCVFTCDMCNEDITGDRVSIEVDAAILDSENKRLGRPKITPLDMHVGCVPGFIPLPSAKRTVRKVKASA